jgi:hypothetical protein
MVLFGNRWKRRRAGPYRTTISCERRHLHDKLLPVKVTWLPHKFRVLRYLGGLGQGGDSALNAIERPGAHQSSSLNFSLTEIVERLASQDRRSHCVSSIKPGFAAAREHLALPTLGSFLWSPTSTANLNAAELTNHSVRQVTIGQFLITSL